MKTKTLLIIIVVVGLIYVYFQISYNFVNQTIKKGTENVVLEYALEHHFSQPTVSYMTSQVKSRNVINVYYQIMNKEEKSHLCFVFNKIGNQYFLLDVEDEVPNYIILLYN